MRDLSWLWGSSESSGQSPSAVELAKWLEQAAIALCRGDLFKAQAFTSGFSIRGPTTPRPRMAWAFSSTNADCWPRWSN